MTVHGLSEPPEGAIVGESVPQENEQDDHRQALVERVKGQLKGHPRFQGRSDAELEEAARHYVRQMEE